MNLMGRACYLIKSTPINDLHFVAYANEELPPYFRETYANNRKANVGAASVSEEIRSAIEEIRSAGPDYRPWYVKNVSERNEKHCASTDVIDDFGDKGFDFYQRLDVKTGPFGLNKVRKSAGKNAKRRLARTFKLPDRRIESDWINVEEFRNYRDWAYARKRLLRKAYEEKVSDEPFKQPFVYYGMHFQPERTTVPDGGDFGGDLFRAVSLLHASLPEDHLIVVKEHPSQFTYTGMGEQSRWLSYYDAFRALPRVRLVPQTYPSLKLLDAAAAVATITGAVGWEAVIRGKPVFCFGHAWYAECEGAFKVTGLNSMREAVERYQSGERPKLDDVWAFVATLAQFGKRVYTSPTREKGFSGEVALDQDLFHLVDHAIRNHPSNLSE